MPPPISPVFAYVGRKGNQFTESELVELLCPQPSARKAPLAVPLNLNSAATVESGGDTYSFRLEKSADGAAILLGAELRRGDFIYVTGLVARRVKGELYEITALLFDNHPERLDSRWEISKVLAHIGKEQLTKACRGELPVAHQEKGKFGKFARFLDRLAPNDPSLIMPPPC